MNTGRITRGILFIVPEFLLMKQYVAKGDTIAC